MTEKTKEFLQKLKDSGNWNDNYDYSKVEYINRETPIFVFDELEFEHKINQPINFLKKGELTSLTLIDKNGYFIQKAKEVHGNKYDYSKVNYINSKTNVVITCKDHGDFEQEATSHLSGRGCKKCGIDNIINKNSYNTEYFIKKANEVHGNKYDYSKTIYVKANKKITIICKKHGEFKQRPSDHLKGQNCSKCSGGVKYDIEYFIQKAKEIHGNKYDYSKTVYIKQGVKVLITDEYGFEHLQNPSSHLQGCKLSIESVVNKNDYFIYKSKQTHDNKYDYSKLEYKNANTKVKIICPEHGIFEQNPSDHLNGKNCRKCSGVYKINTNEFISKAKEIHGDKYDYSKVEYINTDIKVLIFCSIHGTFEQTPYHHINRKQGCNKCSKLLNLSNTDEFIIKAKEIHGDKYDYSKIEYIGSDKNVKIICQVHGLFEQRPATHLRGSGCNTCSNGFTKKFKINLINQLEFSDLLTMDPFEIYTIIGQGKLPVDFGTLANTDANSEERIVSLRELKKQLEIETDEDLETELENITTQTVDDSINEFIEIDDVDIEIIGNTKDKKMLPIMNINNDLHSLDNKLYASMDEEAFESLVQYKLRKLWNNILNKEITVKELSNQTGGKYFTMVKELFLKEHKEVINYKPANGYSFKKDGVLKQPNLMQKLTVQRLLKNKCYGNWSGTGAGKTLSFIVASRTIDSRLTVLIALNSTVNQLCKDIKSVYPDSKCFTEYEKGQVFDRNNFNYLVLNYEKFQQTKSEELFQSLTNNNQIDFVVIDEVHNAKQTEEGSEFESIRRGVMTRLLGRIREANENLYVLAMSATPVVNNLYEAKSLLTLMTGLEYDDLNTRKTLPNALKTFQQLILNGLRYVPKYDIEMSELTGHNMSNLNIDGSHLLNKLLETPQNNYIDSEKLLLEDKLTAIKQYLKKGVIIYTYFTTDFINKIEKYVSDLGYSVGTYTGDESIKFRENNLKRFISGDLDILIGSRPIGTGVDGLQDVCKRMIILTLPWTDSEYTQLKGRIYRQGSKFKDVEIIIPQVRIELGEGEFWSWDVQRLNLIKNKKTLADAAVDGIVPSKILPSKQTMFRKSQESLQRWKDRINENNIISSNRQKIQIELYPEVNSEEREQRINSELSEFHRRGKICHSSTMHKEFSDNPDSWNRYHALRNSRMESWEEIPYEYIATKITDIRDVVSDFGCGLNLFRNCIPNNEVYSFDHVAIDDTVFACDMRNTNLKDESIDVAVFSLALWGTNSEEYIKEAYRVLRRKGMIYIAEPSKDFETPEKQQEFVNLIKEKGFQQVGEVENRGKFIYLTGIKI